MVYIVIGCLILLSSALWKSGSNGLRVFAAFTGGAVIIAGAFLALVVPSLESAGKGRAVRVRPSPPALTIVVRGTPGLRFRGHWAVSTLGGTSAEGRIAGHVPHRFTVAGQGSLAVEVHKLVGPGKLQVAIVVNGRQVAEQSASSPYARVHVGYTSNGVS